MNHAEQQLQISVVQFIKHALPPEIPQPFHVPNGFLLPGATRQQRDRVGALRKAMGVRPGVADLIFILPTGKMGCIELKADKGRLSPEQEKWLASADAMGCWTAVCRSPEDVEDTLRRWIEPFNYRLRTSVRRAA